MTVDKRNFLEGEVLSIVGALQPVTPREIKKELRKRAADYPVCIRYRLAVIFCMPALGKKLYRSLEGLGNDYRSQNEKFSLKGEFFIRGFSSAAVILPCRLEKEGF